MLYEVRDEKSSDGEHVFSVGYWDTDGEGWTSMADFETEILAYAFINYLNGGSGDIFEQFKK